MKTELLYTKTKKQKKNGSFVIFPKCSYTHEEELGRIVHLGNSFKALDLNEDNMHYCHPT